ncbi:hypothetical protein [Streptomyces sp. NBC_00572]|uniref:hypothetical protein n=1 Tax=Streptomyces sp. NBC_00572 TaxID=2903664 RepID=UPI002256A529|nr:hypothetical protein [Streptomyces sp. NBC_00572]MCX4982658.1 hypothetical protein [Streptomyces sp. NBC_00572]
MTQNGQGPEPQYPAVPPAQNAQGGAQPYGGAWGPAGAAPGGQPLPPAQPLPPEAAPGGAADMQSTQYLPPIPPQGAPQPGYGYPGPGAPGGADMQATQHIAPVPGGMPPVAPVPGGMPQAQGPQPGYGYPQQAPGGMPQAGPQPGYGYPPPAGDMQATQHIAPVPPQQGGGGQTQFLGTSPLQAQGPGSAGASDATQYIAPVPAQEPGERQPPAEFDNLFRTEAPRAPQAPQQPHAQAYQQPTPAPYQQPAPAPYQQQHQPPQHQQHHQPPAPPQQYAYQDAYYDDGAEPEPSRRRSPVALIAAVVVGCAVVGLGAGALLSGGDEDKDPKKGPQNVAESSAAPSGQPTTPPTEKPADPAEPQAQELSKLLATSSSSRDTVISSVESIKQCKNLDKAASDLRGAAEQRRGLVTQLRSLSVDKIPDNPALTAALTKAWQASAAADDRYAAWGDQMKAKKACKGGKARSTNQLAEANKKSGEATAAKKQAASLWNPTAAKYGLEKRTYTQL